jgi:hypothetical protein
MATDQDTPTEVRMYPALRELERVTPPLKFGRPPYWRPEIVQPSKDVYIPTWNWTSPHDYAEGDEVRVLDVNAAYLAAIGSVQIAHSQLIRRGAPDGIPAPRKVRPGYYRITVPYWAFDGTIVHPLGDSSRLQSESAIWIAAPTLVLLLELAEEGHIGAFEILDAWNADVVTSFEGWSTRLKSLREVCMTRVDTAQNDARRQEAVDHLNAFKRGYSAALSMMLQGQGCLTRRPDWPHTVYAQHAAATWRKAWRFTFTGATLVAMGAVDEIAILAKDLPTALARPKPPFRLDETGRAVGAFKTKTLTTIGCQPARREDEIMLAGGDDLENIL